MNKILALRQYRLFIKSLPKNNRSNNKHLYQNPPEMQDLKLNHEEFIKDFQIYSNSCKEYNVKMDIFDKFSFIRPY